MPELAIKVEELGKRFVIGSKKQPYQTFRERLTDSFRNMSKRLLSQAVVPKNNDAAWIWALENISFEVRRGEVLGIIGRNGAGKSTLLRILSRITEPTCGIARIQGKIGSLLEVGTGFHPELTGRENVYLNGAILGMSKTDIDRKFDQIVEFAEVKRFMDTPIKHYSSGMSMRLAFAVAAHLETEIMLIDEVLAVGDAGFQKKCIALLSQSVQEGRTAILVSHNMGLIRVLCQRAILLDQGRILSDGSTEEVVSSYFQKVLSDQKAYNPDSGRMNSSAYVSEAYFCDTKDNQITETPCGENLRVRFKFSTFPNFSIVNPQIHLRIFSAMGELIGYVGSKIGGFELPPITDSSSVHCEIEKMNLVPGEYFLAFTISDGNHIYDSKENALAFTVTPHDFYGSGILPTSRLGQVLLRSSWKMD